MEPEPAKVEGELSDVVGQPEEPAVEWSDRRRNAASSSRSSPKISVPLTETVGTRPAPRHPIPRPSPPEAPP
jgi:hypothetical protein